MRSFFLQAPRSGATTDNPAFHALASDERWTSDYGAGEEGILEDVRLYQDLKPEGIQVVARDLDDSLKGIILLENPAHLEALYNKLKENLGNP